ncbi:MAG: BatA domain-containing protein [Thermoguttaceae bacterium]|jgi:hypothetical protein
MTFLHASLLAGSALIVVPIVLHLIMRQRPKRLEFPALRFVQRRHETNRRRLKLRHLLLLLLRCGAIALLALALARPSVYLSEGFGGQESPVAAAMVFDLAPHMQYRHDNRTRLEVARELGQRLLAQLPPESQVAVLDTGQVRRGFDADRGLSRQRIDRLEIVGASQPVVRVLGDAAAVLGQSDLGRKEIYVFTDLSRAAWPADAAAALQDHLAGLHGAAVYLIDVGVEQPANFALGEVRLSQQVLATGGSADLQSELSSLGADGRRTVELNVLDGAGRPQKVGEQTLLLKAGEARPVEFHLVSLAAGTHQGFLRIVGQDALAADDTRYFTIEVRPAWPILVAAAAPADEHAVYFTGAVAPAEFRKRGQARFDCHVVDFGQLPGQSPEKYAAVCLLDPPPLEPGLWQRLADYVSEGRGLAVFFGRNAQPVDSFNALAAQQVLPGKLSVQVPRREGDTCLAPADCQHPILRAFAARATSTPWDSFPVFRYWQLIEPARGTVTVLPYSDGRPALVERPLGNGRVLAMTTPISDRPTRDAWNLLPVGALAKPWPFVILVNQITSYLVGASQQQLNYFAGQTVVLPVDDSAHRRTYVLSAPDGVRSTFTPEKRALTITAAEQVGNYQLRSGGRAAGFDLGFSVNLAPHQTRLDRVGQEQLDSLFGPLKYRLARTAEQIDRSISIARVGRELFPGLILLLAGVLAAEYFVANRFYRSPNP